MKGSGAGVYNIPMEMYVFDLAPLREHMDEALALLAPARRDKALRLRRELPRLHSVGAGLLLARLFPGRSPELGPGGKPYLPGERCFSLSHSAEKAVIALSDVPVGADIQHTSPVSAALRRRVLTPREILDGEDFFRCWTRKEAALKCLGTGVDRELNSLDVSDDVLTLDGCTICLHTICFGDYTLSGAALGASAAFTLRELTWDDLVDAKEATP